MSENVVYGPYVPVNITPKDEGRSGFAMTGLVLGIISAVFCFIPIIGMVAFVTAPLAIIFGLLGRKSSSSGKAKAGWIMGVAALAISVLWAILFTAAVGSASNDLNNTIDCINAAQTTAQIDAC